jgi:hypothetical protein
LERGIILQFCPGATSKPDLNDTVHDASEFLVSALELARTCMYVIVTHRCCSSEAAASHVRRRSLSSRTRIWSSSIESFTSERCFDWLRDERHVSPMMSPAATLNKKPSARKFAPFSMALRVVDQSLGYLSVNQVGGRLRPHDTHLASERGRMCLAGSPNRLVRSLAS